LNSTSLLPVHPSHILLVSTVAEFPSISTYYTQEVSKLSVPVNKNQFPNQLVRAYQKTFTKANIQAGFSTSGIYPYYPQIILNILSVPELSLPPQATFSLQLILLQTTQDLIVFHPSLQLPQAQFILLSFNDNQQLPQIVLA